MSLSVVIATYNRSKVLLHAVRSVFDNFSDVELIVVDDASTDCSLSLVRREFKEQIKSRSLVLLRNDINRGVTGSKNEGYRVARHHWVIFLDSDDAFVPGVGCGVSSVLAHNPDRAVIFFRCKDLDGNIVGKQFGHEVDLNLECYLKHTSYGEALTAINKRIVNELPYVEELRGYEGIGCSRIIDRYGPALLSIVIARIYDCSSNDRLSVSSGLLKRMPLLAKGHFRMVKEFGSRMGIIKSFSYLVKAVAYSVLGVAYRMLKN